MKRRPCPTPRKYTYKSQQDALHGAKRLARAIVADGRVFDPLYGYACPCRRWHLTRQATWSGHDNVPLWEVPATLQAWARTPALSPIVITLND